MGRVGAGLGNAMNPFRNPFSNPFEQRKQAAQNALQPQSPAPAAAGMQDRLAQAQSRINSIPDPRQAGAAPAMPQNPMQANLAAAQNRLSTIPDPRQGGGYMPPGNAGQIPPGKAGKGGPMQNQMQQGGLQDAYGGAQNALQNQLTQMNKMGMSGPPPGGAPGNTMNYGKPIPQMGDRQRQLAGGLAGAAAGLAGMQPGGANAYSNKAKGTNFNPQRGNVVGGQLKSAASDTAKPNKINVDPRRQLKTAGANNLAAQSQAMRRFGG